MLRFLIGTVVGFLIAAVVLPENVRLREPVYEAWLAARVFVTELLSDVDEAAERAMEATERATEEAAQATGDAAEETERALARDGEDAGEAPRAPAPSAPDAVPADEPEAAPADQPEAAPAQ